jgi:DNA modification methylase
MPDINIQYYKANDLIMAEYNPRQLTKDQYAQLKDSLTRFGLVDPLIVNKHKSRKNILVGGHQRLKIAKEMGMDKIPCVEVDLPLDQEKELNIRLNKNVGEWDYDSLANYFDVSELMEWGFSNDELQFYEDEPEQGLIDDDEIPEVKEAITKSGDIWLLGEHRVLCGDATKKEDVDILMEGNKADMVFTDPPYGVDYDGGIQFTKDGVKTGQQKKLKNDDVSIYLDVIPMMAKYSSGAIYTWFAGTKAKDIYNAIDGIGGDLHALIIWIKNGGYGALNANYKQKHEPCLYWKPKGTSLNFCGETTETTTWEIDKDGKNKMHPTQKPVALGVKAISNHKADKVLDLFLGSGSTLIACEKTKRKCYGMEIDPHYCDVIVKRWEEFTGNKAERVERAES